MVCDLHFYVNVSYLAFGLFGFMILFGFTGAKSSVFLFEFRI